MTGIAPKVFISYRREETAPHAGRLYDAMAAQFGDANVFMDVDMAPGVDFVERITEAVGGCHVLLVVMGPRWATLSDGDEVPRIAQHDDFVRLEVETALRRTDVTVIPVLVGGARMPEPDELPDAVRPLARRHALELSDMRWRYDVQRLTGTLSELLRDVTGVHEVPPAGPGEEVAARPSAGGVRLVGEGALVAFVAAWIGSQLSERVLEDAEGASDVALFANSTGRGALVLALVGAALGFWVTIVGGGSSGQATRRALVGLLVGAIGGALAGAAWGARFLPAEKLEASTRDLLGQGSSAIAGGFLGALIGVGFLDRRRVLAGFAAGFAAGWLVRLTVLTAEWKIDSSMERVYYDAVEAGVVAGAVIAALLLLGVLAAGSSARPGAVSERR